MSFEYRQETNMQVNEKITTLLDQLPAFCSKYVIARERSTSALTRLDYLRRIDVFLRYLHNTSPYFKKKSIKEITLDDLDRLNTDDIEEFTHAIFIQQADNPDSSNKPKTVDHYLSALNSFWTYFGQKGLLKSNPITNIERSNKQPHEIIRLTDSQKREFFNTVENGTGLTERQETFRAKTSLRDKLICLTLLKTGIRVSELVGLDVDDINFQENCFKIIRKRNKFDTVYFDQSLAELLQQYLVYRESIPPQYDENALFLSTRGQSKGRRISPRAVQLLVKKYATAALPSVGYKITPHKFRATYATDTLEKTNNLALVQTLLAHDSIQTTRLYADVKDIEAEKKRIQNMNLDDDNSF